MNEQLKAIQVAWCSSLDLPQPKNTSLNFELFKIDISDLLGKDFDVIVLDIRDFETLEALRYIYTTIHLPTVILVDTIEQESTVLCWLEAEDDICKRDAIEQQIILRLQRSIWHNKQKHLFNLDKLTGIANFRKFNDYALKLLTSKEEVELVSLIYLDIDRFKFINDSHGHIVGDQILQEIGQLLQKYSLGAGIVARTGGDKFAICLRGSIEQGKAFAEFLKTQIQTHKFQLDAMSCIHLTASFGVVSLPGHSSVEQLWQEINQCIYAAKQKGRNQVVTSEDFDAIADASGQDKLITDFEHRIRVNAERMINEMVLKASRLANKYRMEAERDGLTEIFNRRYLDRLLAREIDKAYKYQQRLTILLLDLDHFGEVNRTYGFPTGDQALRTAAQIFQSHIRAGDWVTRYGGEEFCIVMSNTDLNTGCQIAERIRLALSEEIVIAYNGQKFRLTTSIGAVELMEENNLVSLLQRASDKVRQAKKNGRNQICF
ncbi:diguanylate cyclase (plasmid) [Nostoc sp. NIES-3756]|uniref:diguanylate cyclase n=1 Tax=Nostoc sp. NIES-3756 TaxID=1751286 RepID=UPI0007206911|nr:GGDEF domain-containing protein [Nostoc sp. NIES-3756]BAT56632.1 diguanylate cyclase [Nostoc sp. NIES-3756]BAY41700.1 GGDEF domain-containing protein [Nostoc sp. NIES-2111]